MNKIINNWFALYNLMNDIIEQLNNKNLKNYKCSTNNTETTEY